MANKYLTPEQEAEFIKDLESQGGVPDGGALPPDAEQQAIQEGAQMAAADAQNGTLPGADAPEKPDAATQQANADAQALGQLGFGSVDELVNAYREATRKESEMRSMLTEISAIQQALNNEEQIDPNDPDAKTKQMIQSAIKPLLDSKRAEARNHLIQEKWKSSAAASAADLADLMPDIQEYLKANPRYSVDEDGLQRAYDAVRSKRYKAEDTLTNDPEFLKRMAGNEQIRKAVIESYLQDIARNGEAAPQTITDGGSTPLTSKRQVSGMEQAKQKLFSMLGGKN